LWVILFWLQGSQVVFFNDSSDIKFGTFLNCISHNMTNEIVSKKYQQNCGQSFWDGGSSMPCAFATTISMPFVFAKSDG